MWPNFPAAKTQSVTHKELGQVKVKLAGTPASGRRFVVFEYPEPNRDSRLFSGGNKIVTNQRHKHT